MIVLVEPQGAPQVGLGLVVLPLGEVRLAERVVDARVLGIELLGGQVTEQEGELLFRWPASPMRVAVSLQDNENGPEAIEVRSGRTLALPDEPVPKLGTRFIQL